MGKEERYRRNALAVIVITTVAVQKKLTRTLDTHKINTILMKVTVQITPLCQGPSREGARVPFMSANKDFTSTTATPTHTPA